MTLNNVTNGAELDLRFQRQMLAVPLSPETITIETVLGVTRKNFAMDTFSLSSRQCPPGEEGHVCVCLLLTGNVCLLFTGTKLLGMTRFVDCVCDMERSDVVTCNGRRITLAVSLSLIS